MIPKGYSWANSTNPQGGDSEDVQRVLDKWNKAGLRETRDTDWEEKVQNREEWKEVSVAPKPLEEL